jgi:hypothetical protein
MAAVAGFIYFAHAIYTAESAADAVEALRRREIMAHALIACLLVFLPAYGRTPMRRATSIVFWGALFILFIANLIMRYGLWISTEPKLVHQIFRGMPFASIAVPPFSFIQYAYVTYQFALFALGISYAVILIRSRDRRRGVILAIAAVVVAGCVTVDMVRQIVGGSWPFVAEYGFVGWGIIMSVQLALDYRTQSDKLANAICQTGAQASRLTAILGAMRALEHKIHAPLHELETGIAQLDDGVAVADPQLVRLRRAVARLRALSNAMPNLRTRPRKRN